MQFWTNFRSPSSPQNPKLLKEISSWTFAAGKERLFLYWAALLAVCINYSLFKYATTTAIWSKVMGLNDLKRLPCKTDMESRSPVNEIAYQCGNVFPLEDKTFTFSFVLLSNKQTMAVHENERLDNKKRLVQNVNQVAQKGDEACRNRSTKLAATREVFRASLRIGQGSRDRALRGDGNRSEHAYRSPQMQVMQPPRIPASIKDYRRDRPG